MELNSAKDLQNPPFPLESNVPSSGKTLSPTNYLLRFIKRAALASCLLVLIIVCTYIIAYQLGMMIQVAPPVGSMQILYPNQEASPSPQVKIFQGYVDWNPNVEEIAPSKNMQLLVSIANSPEFASQYDTFKGMKFYKVGTWQSGLYSGKYLVDGVLNFESHYITGSGDVYTGEDIARFTEDANGLVIFRKSSSSIFNDIPESYASRITYVDEAVPDLISSYPLDRRIPGDGDQSIPFTVTYLYKTKPFTFASWSQPSGEFLPGPKDSYRFLTTFFRGQKLYGVDPSINPVPWARLLGNPYYVEDLDHSLDELDWSDFPSVKNVRWIKEPDLLANVTGYHQEFDPEVKTAADIMYSSSGFMEGCEVISTDKFAGGSMFDSSKLELVASSNDYRVYRPANADQLLRYMYDYVVKGAPSLTYERYLASFPLLVFEDVFGTYNLMFRMDYPGHPQGCGKPVIYLYPTQKTDVRISFSKEVLLTKTEPSYNGAWDVTAYPDGELVNRDDNKIYPYLFWEGATSNRLPDLTYGEVIQKENIPSYLNERLKAYGLNEKETKDFVDYWVPFLRQKPYYLIRFYTTRQLSLAIPEYINPKPDSLLRLLMEYQGLDEPVKVNAPPPITPFSRHGFTVIEWGGIYGN